MECPYPGQQIAAVSPFIKGGPAEAFAGLLQAAVYDSGHTPGL